MPDYDINPPTDHHTESVTVLGLGAMGAALAGAFGAKGRPTIVWNRTTAKAEALSGDSIRAASDLIDAVRASNTIIVCLLDYSAVEQTLGGVRDDLVGRTVVNLTNGTPREARDIAAWAAANEISYLDGGIMAIPPMIGQASARTLYSGDRATFDDLESVLDDLGTATFIGDDPGRAALLDLALLTGMYGLYSGWLHAAALVKTEDITAGSLLELMEPWLHGMMTSLPGMAYRIDHNDHDSDVLSPLSMQVRALDNIVTATHDQGLTADLVVGLRHLATVAVADGHGPSDLAGIVPTLTAQPVSSS